MYMVRGASGEVVLSWCEDSVPEQLDLVHNSRGRGRRGGGQLLVCGEGRGGGMSIVELVLIVTV